MYQTKSMSSFPFDYLCWSSESKCILCWSSESKYMMRRWLRGSESVNSLFRSELLTHLSFWHITSLRSEDQSRIHFSGPHVSPRTFFAHWYNHLASPMSLKIVTVTSLGFIWSLCVELSQGRGFMRPFKCCSLYCQPATCCFFIHFRLITWSGSRTFLL